MELYQSIYFNYTRLTIIFHFSVLEKSICPLAWHGLNLLGASQKSWKVAPWTTCLKFWKLNLFFFFFFFFFFCRLLLPFRHHIFSHIMYFIYFFVFYTICLSLGCSDDVDMTDHPPPHTTSAAPETKQCWRRWRSHIPLSPVEQPRLPLLFFFFFFF